ncbi:MAG TPA: glycosyltransferase family 4 protein [Candidatus Saccharimonadales bacterium]|nr:glycosyltransferase family 4 protein [Candidatus Saccharimonadales bacterium]
MKIGLVCPYNIAKGGGVQEHVRAQYTELRNRGHVVKILTPQPRDGSAEGMMDDIIFVGGATDFRSPTHTSLQVSASVDTEAIGSILAKEDFDILHFHEPWVPVLSRQVLSRSTSVNIATFHGVIPETLMSKTVIKVVTPYCLSILKYLHELTAVSEPATEYIMSLTDAPVSIIPNGINLSHFKKRGTKNNKIKAILYIGRLERRKGVKYLLQAYKVLCQDVDDVELIIAGDGPDREKLELLAEDLELKNVSFLGYIGEETKLELLQKVAVFCSPAIFGESFGIVLLEAMACGAVTVAGNNVGYSSLMQDTGALSIVNPRDAEDFARRLKLMLEDKDVRALWQTWADKFIEQFSWPRVIDQYELLYESALKKHRK